MHSIAISPGVEDSVHLRTSSLSLPHNPVAFSPRLSSPLRLSFSRRVAKGVGTPGRELHPADNTSWTDNEPARLSSYVHSEPLKAPSLTPCVSTTSRIPCEPLTASSSSDTTTSRCNLLPWKFLLCALPSPANVQWHEIFRRRSKRKRVVVAKWISTMRITRSILLRLFEFG